MYVETSELWPCRVLHWKPLDSNTKERANAGAAAPWGWPNQRHDRSVLIRQEVGVGGRARQAGEVVGF